MDPTTDPFSAFGLAPSLLHAVEAVGYTRPTAIQAKAIPAILFGKDVLGIADTGSGKTLSYALPILHRLLEGMRPVRNRHVPVLVLVPTRELAQQVEAVFQSLCAHLPQRTRTQAVFGGVSINPQMIALQGVQVLVATPGRLLDLVETKAVHLGDVQVLVLDEADKMLNREFEEELGRLLKLLPRKRQNLLYSATLNAGVSTTSELVLHKPEVIQCTTAPQEITLIEQRAFRIAPERKGPLLRYLIHTMDMAQVLVFTATSHGADHVADKLRKHGIDARATHGKKSHHARQQALTDLKAGRLRVLVTTDLLARGIDIVALPFVINYELPRSPQDFVHRIGRTGRAEHAGQAFTLVTPEDQHHFKVIQKKMGQWITLESMDDVDLSPR